MRGIAIYVEGGGDTAQQKSDLRVGLDRLLDHQKQAARHKRLHWKLVPCGGRESTFAAFMNAIRNSAGNDLCLLLVDSEEGIPLESKGKPTENARVRKNHLVSRDGWDLEEEPKSDLYSKLAKATKDSSKGEYSERNHAKIKHASKLLARIDPETVAKRCPRFATLRSWLDEQIRNA